MDFAIRPFWMRALLDKTHRAAAGGFILATAGQTKKWKMGNREKTERTELNQGLMPRMALATLRALGRKRAMVASSSSSLTGLLR